MAWYEVMVALLVALGGAGGLVQLFKAWRAWRDGVQQKSSAPTERLVAYLETQIAELKQAMSKQAERIVVLEEARDRDGAYITVLSYTMAGAGITVPPRPAYGEVQ